MQKQKANKLEPQLQLKRIAAVVTLAVAASTTVYAQSSGKLMGTITNSKTGETITGVTVRILGTSRGGSSDVSGKYSIPALPAGKYTVEYIYVGYSTKQVTEVEIKANDLTNLDIVLDNSEGQVLDQVVVTGSFKKESIGALYSQQKNSALISDGISSEQIRRSPDKNTSEALRRVSGATIQDNKFVVVRGLGDRYNVSMMDGSVLPSTEANRRAFSFDIVPSNLIDKITISKTATPDLPADFAGGAVQITTKDIPDQNFVSFGLGYGYNTASTFKDFLQTKKNFQNYLGFDDGSSNLATNMYTREQVKAGLSGKENRLALKSLPNDLSIENKKALPSQNYQFSLGKVKQFENNNKFGALFSVTYRNSQNVLSNVRREWHQYDFTDNQYRFSNNLGALANFGYTFGKNKITWKNLYNKNYDNTYTSRTGIDLGANFDNRFSAYDILEKSLFKSTVDGEHVLSDKNDKIKWTASWSNIKNDQPNQVKLNYVRPMSAANDPSVPFTANLGTIGKQNTRLFAKLNENIYSGEGSYILPINFLTEQSTLKVGAGGNYRKRTFDARFIGFQFNENAFDNVDDINKFLQTPADQIFSAQNINNNYFRYVEIMMNGDKYEASSVTSFGYAMLDQKFNDKFRVVYGLRVENYNVKIDALNVDNMKMVEDVNDTKLDFLPSVNFTYSVTPKSNVRASYYRTLARPELRELASFKFYDFEQLGMITGNPDLKRASINNADLRYEIYPSAGEILSISAFYKQFTDAIEPRRYDVTSTPDIRFGNVPKANLYGAELEVRKKLNFVNDQPFFRNTTAYLNLAFVHSEVTNPTDQPYLEQKRPMVGQSPYVINGGLQHTALDSKLNLNILYNRIGKRIIQPGGQTFASAWEAPRNVLDFQVGYKVLKNKGEFKLNASDILNNSINVYFDNKVRNISNETWFKYKPGANYSLSFNYTF